MSNSYKERKYPEKSWSISKMKTLESCEREYYYTYYGSHNGWLFNSTDEQKSAWRLKKLTNLWMCFGEVVHSQIRGITYACKNNKLYMDKERFIQIALNTLRSIIKESIEKYNTNEWNENPKGTMLEEYYYGEKISKDTGNELKEKLSNCAESFFKSKTFEGILKPTVKILENDVDIFPYFTFNELKIYSKLDLLYIDDDGYYVIVDWKTGKSSKGDNQQLLVYAWYVTEKYNVHYSKIKGRLEYLSEAKVEEILFKEDDFKYIKQKVTNDLKIINYFLDDATLNKAKDKQEFYKTEKKWKCERCKFRLLCNEECN